MKDMRFTSTPSIELDLSKNVKTTLHYITQKNGFKALNAKKIYKLAHTARKLYKKYSF